MKRNNRKSKCGDKEHFSKTLYQSTSISDLGRKLGYKCKGNAIPGGVSKLLRQKIEEYKLDTTHLKGQGWSKGLNKKNNKSIEIISKKISLSWDECFKNGSNVKNQTLIKKLIESGKRKYVCQNCGISKWMNKNIVLELHHINEKFNDNRENNLSILCPNCHSIIK